MNNNIGFITWWKERARKDFNRLILPAIFTISIILLISSFSYIQADTYLKEPKALILIEHPTKPFNYINIVGNLWFLFALFFSKQFFYILRRFTSDEILPFACVAIGWITVISSSYVVFPLSISTGLSVLTFIYAGYYIKVRGGVEKGIPRLAVIGIAIWTLYIFYGRLRVGSMIYSWGYLPDVIAACGGTYFFYLISKLIEKKNRYLKVAFSFLGEHSLILICAPTIETYCFPMQTIMPELPFRFFFVIAGKVGWCAIAIYACIRIPALRKIFGVNNLSHPTFQD